MGYVEQVLGKQFVLGLQVTALPHQRLACGIVHADVFRYIGRCCKSVVWNKLHMVIEHE